MGILNPAFELKFKSKEEKMIRIKIGEGKGDRMVS
jgi:hypothetical protein